MVTVSLQLLDKIEEQLRAELDDLSAAAKEATLVELYRQERLSEGKLAECLGNSQY